MFDVAKRHQIGHYLNTVKTNLRYARAAGGPQIAHGNPESKQRIVSPKGLVAQ